jgi:hypothetical protein
MTKEEEITSPEYPVLKWNITQYSNAVAHNSVWAVGRKVISRDFFGEIWLRSPCRSTSGSFPLMRRGTEAVIPVSH